MDSKKIYTKSKVFLASVSILSLTLGISLGAQSTTATSTPAPTKKITISGFFKADYIYADNAVMSTSSETMLTPTHAKRQTQSDDKNPRSAFTPNNSRIGLTYVFSDKVKGYFEIDAAGASGTAPGTSSLFRVRDAFVSYTPNSKTEIFMGQRSDIFSPLAPHSYNVSAVLYNAGNVANRRNQIAYSYKISDMMTVKAALGSTHGASSTGTAGPQIGVELNSTPTYAFAFQFNPMKNLKLHLSAITADLKVRQPSIDGKRDSLGTWIAYDVGRSCVNTTNTAYPTNLMGTPSCGTPTYAQSWVLGGEKTQRVKAGGYSFGFDFDPTDKLNVKMEYNQGENLGTLGSLAISAINSTTYGKQWTQNNPDISVTGSNANTLGKMFNNDNRPLYNSIKEQAAWISWNMKVAPTFEIGTHHGVSKITNPEDLNADTAAYNFVGSTTVTDSGVNKIKENQVHGYRIAYKPADAGGLILFVQHDYHRTLYATRKSESGMMDWIKSISMTDSTTTLNGRFADASGANVASGKVSGTTTPYTLDAWSFHKASAEARAHVLRMGMMLPF